MLDFLDCLVQVDGQFRRQLFVIGGDHGVAGHNHLVRQIVQIARQQRLKINPYREQRNAVHGNVIVDQMVRQCRGARSAVAFTEEEQGERQR